jgi:CDP-6-deoxy-D-xylo-4-hexulose-3-dehydrase
VRKDAGFSRNDIVKFLEANRIETRNFFSGNLLCHPAYQNTPCRVVGDLNNSNLIMNSTFFIGLFPGIEDDQLCYIEEIFSLFMNGNRV